MNALWFYDLGIRVFPTVNKIPATRSAAGLACSWLGWEQTREQAAAMKEYAVPLGAGSFAVVDTDTDAAETWVAEMLPMTPFMVRTARGVHRYYRLRQDAPHYIHRAGHTIEFRHQGQYVIGPGSVRPDGKAYVADVWSWNSDEVPFFPVDSFVWDDRGPEARGVNEAGNFVLTAVAAGERHDQMFKLMRSLQARGVDNLEALVRALHIENQLRCVPPISRSELDKYLRRIYRYHDRKDFTRIPMEESALAAAVLETGISADALLVIMRSVNPQWGERVEVDVDWATLTVPDESWTAGLKPVVLRGEWSREVSPEEQLFADAAANETPLTLMWSDVKIVVAVTKTAEGYACEVVAPEPDVSWPTVTSDGLELVEVFDDYDVVEVDDEMFARVNEETGEITASGHTGSNSGADESGDGE